jgi:hypothetical protein
MFLSIALSMLLVTAVGMAAGYWFWLRPVEEEAVHHLHCPRCQQRFRFREMPAARAVLCPRCLRGFSLPAGLR